MTPAPISIAPGSLVAVAGATGYIGTRLVPRLAAAGFRVRCLARSPRKLHDRPWFSDPAITVVESNLEDEAALADQLRGCTVAFYLVHSMQSAGAQYATRDRDLASRFARAAGAAAVQRIVYLGGLGDAGERLSAHLSSRREVERVLSDGPVPVTTSRAAMIIGSGWASFEILRYLAERLPVLITPRWVRTESQPISVRNVLHYLVAYVSVPDTAGRVLEIGGADVASYQTLIQTMCEERGLPRRIIIPVPVLTPFLSSLWIHLVTPVSARMARPLAEGLRNRVVVQDDTAARLMPQTLLGARESIRIALDAEARSDVESTWWAAGPVAGDPDWAGGDVFEDSREAGGARPRLRRDHADRRPARLVSLQPAVAVARPARPARRRPWRQTRSPRSGAARLGRSARLLARLRARARPSSHAARRDAGARRRGARLRAATGRIGQRDAVDPPHPDRAVQAAGTCRSALLVRRPALPRLVFDSLMNGISAAATAPPGADDGAAPRPIAARQPGRK